MKTVLFDMDGTLTPPRQKIERKVINALRPLAQAAALGIVTGSDFDYLLEQCSELFEIGGLDPGKVRLFPCNGTKEYAWVNNSWVLLSSTDMIQKISTECYRLLLKELTKKHLHLLDTEGGIKYSGTFFQYRGSMLNWCPIGRSASLPERRLWEAADLNSRIRKPILENLNAWIENNNYDLTITLGGGTSFDIYPSGWDKTYVFKHVDVKNCYFLGDKCTGVGNDRTIYEKVKKEGLGAFNVKGPAETISTVKNFIIPQLGEN